MKCSIIFAQNRNMQTLSQASLSDVIAHAKEYGFVFPSSEIYDGLQAVYDYGHNGVELKNNLKQYWWLAMTRLRDDVVGIDSAIFMHPTIWKASGHVDSFNDPMIDNRDSKKRYRADVLIEEAAAKIENTNPKRAQELVEKLARALEKEDFETVRQIIVDEKIVCPISGTANWTEVRQFNLMFSTQIGALADDADQIYLRPETAQGIFVNFLNVQKTSRQQLPFGIAQIGKAFRNEVVARQFIFRMREFEQMEMQYFVRPGTQLEWFDQWKAGRMAWHKLLGIAPEKFRFKKHEKLAHYADAAVDIEFEFPFGFKEVEGIHSRTDFDLSAHQTYSRKKLQYHDTELKQSYVPYVVETSIGADRLFLMVLSAALTHEKIGEGDNEKARTYLKIHPALAPIKAAIFPLVKKDGMPEKAMQIFNELKYDFKVFYEDSAAIGKRYTRQDLIGTPYCITVDGETLQNDTVTIRDRDTTAQQTVPLAGLKQWLYERVSMESLLRKL